MRQTLQERADDLGSVCPQAWVDLALCDVAAGSAGVLQYTEKATQDIDEAHRGTSEFVVLRALQASLLR